MPGNNNNNMQLLPKLINHRPISVMAAMFIPQVAVLPPSFLHVVVMGDCCVICQ